MENLAALVDDGAALGPARPAFVHADGVVSYGDLVDQISASRAALRDLGVQRGDRVAISLAFAPDFAVAFYGALGIGAIAVPMNPALTPREAGHYLADSGAKVLLAHPHAAAWTTSRDVQLVGPDQLRTHVGRAELVSLDAEDTAVILYTSGTTGTPKGAELTHGNLAFNATTLADLAIIGPLPSDVVAGVLPLFHTMGLTVLNLTLAAGAAMWPVEKFDARQIAELIDSAQITLLAGVPTHVQMIMTHSEDLRFRTPLRRVTTGGAEIQPTLRTWVEERLGTPVIEGYGLTEASPTVASHRDDAEIRNGSAGRPLPGVDVQIVDPQGNRVPPGELGEIIVRGPNVMKGYWNNPDATAQAVSGGWLATGDIGRVDADGYLYLVDRLKQLIIRGGYNVYPREIETVLREHPAVADVAVVGIPDDRLGEEIAAFIVGTDAPRAEQQIREHARANLASYKSPRRFIFVDELPKTPTGKIARAELRSSLLPTE
ncbi:MAG TPA: AMP-binding protein [Pseudonocardiaceae bacterium]|jgi:long-chain acyl-CoA synthetase